MKIKFYTIAALFIVSIFSANAQEMGKTRFAVLGGVNFQTINGKDGNGDILKNKILTGFHIGCNVQIPVAPEFYFQPGIMYSTKGARVTSNYAVASNYKLSYLEVPMNFVYRGALGKGFVLVGFGPYIGYGIGGRTTSGTSSRKIQFKNSIDASDSSSNIPYSKAFDAGANVFAGYEMAGGLFFQLNTQLGMLKINPENKAYPNDKTAMKNTGFGFSLGYRFK